MQIKKTNTNSSPKKDIPSKVHQIFVIDCSGSMYGEIGRIRAQMKNKIPQLSNVGDTVSIIWFSGRNQCGVLQEGLEIRSVTDFTALNSAIDKYLKPMGLTGFKEPLDEVARISTLLKSNYSQSASHMFFMTDGHDNQWSLSDILKSSENLTSTIDGATIVEYGWYCNRSVLTKMAQTIGANMVFSDNFQQYDAIFSKAINKKIVSTKKIEVDLGDYSLDYAFTKDGDDVISFEVVNGKVVVPEYVTDLFYFTSTAQTNIDTDDESKYVAIYTLAQRMMGNDVINLLGELGDIYLIDMFNNCFSKQDYSEFQEAVHDAIKSPSNRFKKGKNTNYLPAPDCPTIIDFLDEVASNHENKFHPYDPNFSYDKISASRVDANSVLTDDEKNDLIEQIKNSSSPQDALAIAQSINQLNESKVKLTFTPDVENGGYKIDALTFNEERPNISVRIKITGTVELPENQFPSIPNKFPTYIYRNYAVVKDGIKHTSLNNFPVELSEQSFNAIKAFGVIDPFEAYVKGKIYYINANLPVINRNMVKNVSAKDFFTKQVMLQSLKSKQKVLNTFRKQHFDRVSDTYITTYGEDATQWLKELGITDFGGFAPKKVSVEPTDEYEAKIFKVSIAKCSSIPTINEKLLDKVKNGGKFTLSESLCVPAIKSYNTLLESPVYNDAADKVAILKSWLESESNDATKKVRELIRETAKIQFSIMVGHVWFNEFNSLDENEMEIEFNGEKFSCKAELKDTVIKI